MLDEQRFEHLQKLLSKLNITEKVNLKLIHQALIHPSYLYDKGVNASEHNQRLEFLGDAVVNLVVAQALYEKNPGKTEGELTKMRAMIVCEHSFFQVAQELGLGDYLLLGKGEEHMGGAQRPSNLADGFEALMGALYLSIGLEKLTPSIISILKNQIKLAARGKYSDYKTRLQEELQKNAQNKISYKILHEEGPDHAKHFVAAVYLNEEFLAEGEGSTKKEAERQAAKAALIKMESK